MTGPLWSWRAAWSGPWGIGTILRRLFHWLDSESPGAVLVLCLAAAGIGVVGFLGVLVVIWILLVGYVIR